ncbi:MAG: NAD(P)-dependent oxidoreductase [Enterovirga sp.]|jgi:3-hydroxyisobutyrate dehydrogenase-like beta-hydroxyacid dehydrogenase|nr:NAD(P)-dependent oxidoreductase [Enterovirga sp.]
MADIGFIGLGLMGAGFTKRLVGCGHRVIGFDLEAERLREAQGWGVLPAASLAEAASAASLVFVCVTTSAAVRDVVLGLVAAGGLAGRSVIDVSTTEMGITRGIAAAVAGAGGAFIDAPVSGGPAAAEVGTLAIMAGGETGAVEAARPVLQQLGLMTHMGPTGAGQATKLVNQALCLTNYVICAEGLRLAEAYGVDASRIPAALAPGLGNSAVLQAIFPRMVAKDYAPRGYARQILKDLELVHEATRAQHLAMPMLSQALTLFRLMVGQGKSELDGAAIVTLLPEVEVH